MNLLRRSRRNSRRLPLFIAVVLFYLAIVPSDNTHTDNYSSVTYKTNPIISTHISASQGERTHFLTVYSGNEMLNDIESNLMITRSFRDFKSIVIRFFNIILPFVDLGVLVYCLGYFIRKKNQDISVMAISIGGHAPPRILRISHAF
ncbi:MAG TPA: hypothetical protein VN258_13150 [Mobilitalea sp.]|nr:hypothetical protein [Mobilitalea sp.]